MKSNASRVVPRTAPSTRLFAVDSGMNTTSSWLRPAAPTMPEDFIRELAEPFPLKLSVEHLQLTQHKFAISSSEEVLAPELTRKAMTTRSVCEAVGADPDAVFKEIAEISQQAQR